ncbi:MAG: type II toxin-antitoxin system HicB family antitoxin [Candidatus Omnitrophota bacterium]|jgi:antitoxin HicB|nr:MAG: type II toxin-antitoxin system HicB family antitoxin [Candidatus Omnitrophota bacterium]
MNQNRFTYPVLLTIDEEDGGFVVTFADIPEAITQGDTVKEALAEAEDCLEEAIAAYMHLQRDIPFPSNNQNNQPVVSLAPAMTAKANIYTSMRETGFDCNKLARFINCKVEEIEKLLNPRYPADLTLLQSALTALGKKLFLIIQNTA